MPAPLVMLVEVLVGGFGAALELSGAPAGVTAITVLAALAVLLTLAVALRSVALPSHHGMAPSAVRQRATRTTFLDLCDPDAAGRPRPRAPSSLPRVA